MYAGYIVEDAPAMTSSATPRHPYTGALLEAVPPIRRGTRAAGAASPASRPTSRTCPPGCPFRRAAVPQRRLRRGDDGRRVGRRQPAGVPVRGDAERVSRLLEVVAT